MEKLKKETKGITMVVLVVTIIVLLILSAVVISLTVGQNGLFSRSKQATDEHIKQEAREAMNLKITGIQIECYTENGKLPDLQYLADKLCEDTEMHYVFLESQKEASLDKINVENVNSIFTKMLKYPYEFEIDRELKLASIDGVKIASSESTLPDGYIKPEGTLEITENGEHDVSNYEKAKVEVPTYEENSVLKITEQGSKVDVSNYQYADTTGLYTKSQYDNNYSSGYNAGENAAWKKITQQVSRNAINGYTFNIGYVPRFIFIKATLSNGLVFAYWSEDSCITFYEHTNNTTTNVSTYFKRASNGITTQNWLTTVDYTFEIWALK